MRVDLSARHADAFFWGMHRSGGRHHSRRRATRTPFRLDQANPLPSKRTVPSPRVIVILMFSNDAKIQNRSNRRPALERKSNVGVGLKVTEAAASRIAKRLL